MTKLFRHQKMNVFLGIVYIQNLTVTFEICKKNTNQYSYL